MSLNYVSLKFVIKQKDRREIISATLKIKSGEYPLSTLW